MDNVQPIRAQSPVEATAGQGECVNENVPSPAIKDLRDKIPVLGLKEYWYPAILHKKVNSKKPVFLKMLGEDLCLFRGKSGKVLAAVF